MVSNLLIFAQSIIECIVRVTLILGLLPRLRVPVDSHTFSLGEFGSLTIGLTPISTAVPANPDVGVHSPNQLSLFIEVN
jgi:hypothetical protein